MKLITKTPKHDLRQKIVVLLVMTLVAAMGTYYVLYSSAEQRTGKKELDYYVHGVSTDFWHDEITRINDSTVNYSIYADLTVSLLAPVKPLFFRYNMGLDDYYNRVSYMEHWMSDCTDITSLKGQTNARVFSRNFTYRGSLDNLVVEHNIKFFKASVQTCAEVTNLSVSMSGYQNVIGANWAVHSPGIGSGTGDDGGGTGDGRGDAGSGEGRRGTGDGAGGGGSGGSTAKKQTDKPNNVPASSSQGDTKQPDLDPSPFFDGKEYKSGSAMDTIFGGVFSRSGSSGVAGKAQALAAALLVVGIIVGSYIWWRKHHKV